MAGQTAKATDEISAHIVSHAARRGKSVGAIKAIGQTIERISGITTSISSAVEQQGTATKSIAEGVEGRRRPLLEVADNIERVAKDARETGTTSGLMLKSAKELSEVSSHLKVEVEVSGQRSRSVTRRARHLQRVTMAISSTYRQPTS